MATFLLCGAPHDPATPKAELANVYATLTELNHYSDPLIPFSAQYGTDGQRLHAQREPDFRLWNAQRRYNRDRDVRQRLQ